MDEVREKGDGLTWLEVLPEGRAGSLCSVPSEEERLGDADGVGGSARGGLGFSRERAGRGEHSSASPCRKDALLLTPRGETPEGRRNRTYPALNGI